MLTMTKPNVNTLKKMIFDAAYKSKESHVGSALSIIEIMYTLYFKVANISKENINKPTRDKIILSKGHAALAQYAALTMKGIINEKDFQTYALNNGAVPAYVCKSINGIEVSTGMSLGHGLGLAQGFAIANRLDEIDSRIFVIVGDGELQEGSIYEALNSISRMNLTEITIIIDKNEIQASAKTRDIVDNSNLGERLSSMGFYVVESNGHNIDDLENALKIKSNRPLIVIAHTIKGHGCPKYENTVKSHYIKFDTDIYNNAISTLEEN